MRKAVLLTVLAAAAALVATSATRSSAHGGNPQPTIGFIVPQGSNGFFMPVEKGALSAATAIGDHLLLNGATEPPDQISAVKSMIAQHVSAIVIDNNRGPGATRALLPVLAQARAAGIATLSYENRYRGSVFVNPSSPEQYGQALADALAQQMGSRGQYAVVPCRPAASIVQTWLKAVEAYVPARYPGMTRVAVVYGGTGNGPEGTLVLRPLLKQHPQLRGLIFLCPSESWTGPPQLIRAHEVGKIFTAGNGGGCPPLDDPVVANSVRKGAAQMVCGGDPVALGYLAVWAADYLAKGKALTPGRYDVGGPVGTVDYYAANLELRLGRPLTITRANLGQYGG